MVGGQVHDPIEPLPEGETPVRDWLPAELGPRDDQVLVVVRLKVGVPEHLAGEVVKVLLSEAAVRSAG